MSPAMYIFANKGLKMSPGKLAAQVAHAAVLSYDQSEPYLIKEWLSGGHYTKLVMEAESNLQMFIIDRYLQDRNFLTFMVIDEGLTEITPCQPTALGVEIVDRHEPHTADTFSTFRTYRENRPKAKKRRFWK